MKSSKTTITRCISEWNCTEFAWILFDFGTGRGSTDEEPEQSAIYTRRDIKTREKIFLCYFFQFCPLIRFVCLFVCRLVGRPVVKTHREQFYRAPCQQKHFLNFSFVSLVCKFSHLTDGCCSFSVHAVCVIFFFSFVSRCLVRFIHRDYTVADNALSDARVRIRVLRKSRALKISVRRVRFLCRVFSQYRTTTHWVLLWPVVHVRSCDSTFSYSILLLSRHCRRNRIGRDPILHLFRLIWNCDFYGFFVFGFVSWTSIAYL